MKYGHFDNLNKEYVIETYNTPRPWINYLTNGEMFSLVSSLGGGYSYYKDAKLRRITRFNYNSPSKDNNGRMFYINDGKELFSPSFFPLKNDLDFYECHVGLNYTRFISKKNDISMNLLCFIPLDDNVEINVLKIKNESKEVKNIKVYSCVEFCLWNALDDMTNFQRNLSIGEVEVNKDFIIHKTEYRERRNHFAFYTNNEDIKEFDTDRDTFLGQYNDYSSPKSIVNNNKLNNSVASGWSPIAAIGNSFSLKPNEEKTLIYLLGYVENKDEEKFDKDGLVNKTKAYEIKNKYSNIQNVNKAFLKLQQRWTELLSVYHIESKDEKLNTMVNIWNQYQCMMTYHLSRSASYFESGIGRGMGFRDSCQDLLGFVHLEKDLAKQRILDIASIMSKDGSTFHQYQPLDKKGNKDIGSGFNDDSLWLVGATYAYIAETGDLSILDEIIPFADNEKDSLLSHLYSAINFTINHLGPHGLPLIGHADWNDCLNLNCFSKTPGESFQTHQCSLNSDAESVFIGALFINYGKQFVEILKKLHLPYEMYECEINKMIENMEKYGYEEDHFLRAYDAYGNKIGSNSNKEGQIYIEPQGMAVIAGVGINNNLARKALDSVHSRLNTKYGITLLSPCYSSYHLELGEISSYPTGYKENGGIFCHNNPWIIIAECLLDNIDYALEYYQKITPSYIEDISDIHKTEPYVYSQMIAGNESPNFGEAKNSWLTGTSAWSFVSVSQYILGVRPTLDGLIIDPKIEIEMDIYRKFRNKNIHIHLKEGKHQKIIIKESELKEKEEDIYVEL